MCCEHEHLGTSKGSEAVSDESASKASLRTLVARSATHEIGISRYNIFDIKR